MPSRWQGFQRVGRIVPVPIALCALGGHYALYGALVPTGGAHAYLRWYEPVVAGLSITALTLLGALVAASFTGSERLRRRVSQVAAPFAARAEQSASTRALRLALASAAFLVAQESAERSVTAGHASVAEFSSAQVLVLLAVLAVLGAVVARVEAWCARLAALVVRRAPAPAALRASEPPQPYSAPRLVRRRNPLAERHGLRAPPLAA